jgi:hypothetical protein
VAHHLLYSRGYGGIRARGLFELVVDQMIFTKRKNNKDDIGLRLVKILLLRLYTMVSTMPLKWYEVVIAVVLGSLLGLGVGTVVVGYLKVYLQWTLIRPR